MTTQTCLHSRYKNFFVLWFEHCKIDSEIYTSDNIWLGYWSWIGKYIKTTYKIEKFGGALDINIYFGLLLCNVFDLRDKKGFLMHLNGLVWLY